MALKRYNPYKVASKEVTKFRGVTDPSEAYNANEAYASSMNNVESFKIRAMSTRSGQDRDDDLANGTIHAGGSFVSLRGICAGAEIMVESKSRVYSARAKRYPWREIVIPNSFTKPVDSALTVRCRDINVPTAGSVARVSGKDNDIVNEDSYLSCFETTCSDYWSLMGTLSGYDEKSAESATVVDLKDAFGICYEEIESNPIVPEFKADTVKPWNVPGWPNIGIGGSGSSGDQFPALPGIEIGPPPMVQEDQFNEEGCVTKTISFNPPAENEVTMVIDPGYTEPVTLDLVTSAVIESNDSFSSNVYLTAEASSGARKIGIAKRVSTTSKFSCSKSGSVTLTIIVPVGIPTGTILRGFVRSGAPGVSWQVPLTIYFPVYWRDLWADGEATYNSLSKSVTTAGTFPTMNAALDEFIANEYAPSSGVLTGGDGVTSSYTRQTCHIGFNNVILTGEQRTVIGYSQDYTVPTIGGVGQSFSGVFSWTEERTTNGDAYTLAEMDPTVNKGYACGWWAAEPGADPRPLCNGTSGPSASVKVHQEYSGSFSQNSTVTIPFATPLEPAELPGDVDPLGGTITNYVRITNLKFLAMK